MFRQLNLKVEIGAFVFIVLHHYRAYSAQYMITTHGHHYTETDDTQINNRVIDNRVMFS